MESIGKQVFIETQYPGVTLGIISHSQGLVQIDAPPSPEDGRSWRASLMGLGGGPERILVNLDAHPDRILGVRAMECNVIAHEQTAEFFRNKPSTFKSHQEETGANWETIAGGMTGIRWGPPEISFTDAISMQWGETQIVLESHPGPSAGAIWVSLPDEKIVFVGDVVLKNQPPFLADADLPAWIDSLSLLLSKEYKDFTKIGGRDGVVTDTVIKKQLDFNKDLHKRLERTAKRRQKNDMTEGLIKPLLSKLKFPAARLQQYTQRLRYGLQLYYARHYHPGSEPEE